MQPICGITHVVLIKYQVVVGEHGMRDEGNDMLRMDGLYSLDAGETDMASGAKRKQSLYDEHRKRMHIGVLTKMSSNILARAEDL
jgi:hypothetical protein